VPRNQVKKILCYVHLSLDSIHDNDMPNFSLGEIREFTWIKMLKYRGSKWDSQKWELGSVVKGKLNAGMREAPS